MEAQLESGLIIGHAYSVTDVRYVSLLFLLFRLSMILAELVC